MRTIRAPESKQTTTLQVAVRCRPLTPAERSRYREVIRIENDKVVVVSDSDGSRKQEKRYTFDYALGPEYKNQDIYNRVVAPMIQGVCQGLNATVFAYGATGSGKTYTMAGRPDDPGLMVLSLQEIFRCVSKEEKDHKYEVTCSYLEVYNEVIYDLLDKSSGHLELREDPEQGIVVAGLRRVQVNSTAKILELLHVGNSRRKTEKTDANAISSRSHAVLEIMVKKFYRNHHGSQVLQGKMALVDLAGSERASETNNVGRKLRDGANINKSLLALANCINALGKQQKKGLAYVPYRNSKLTRILKDGLSGNSRTCMIATVSFADHQYHHTMNTLKYANRAKEIKTHVQKNVGTVNSHVADYQRLVSNLQAEVSLLRKELEEKEVQLNGLSTCRSQDDGLSWLDTLSRDINENVEDRINLQKALFELEDKNTHNHHELQQLDNQIAKHQFDEDNSILETLCERRKVILDNIRDNDEAGAVYRQEIEQNEAQRRELQEIIEKAISSNNNATYLRILSQYRLLGMTNTELQFQIAIRDQIIDNQREVVGNLWSVLKGSGLHQRQILELASRQGITIEGWGMPSPINYMPHRAGSPLSKDILRNGSIETCTTSGLVQFTSVTSRYLECTNSTVCHSNAGIQNIVSPNFDNRGFYPTSFNNKKEYVNPSFTTPDRNVTGCQYSNVRDLTSPDSYLALSDQNFLQRALRLCSTADTPTGFSDNIQGLRLDNHVIETRQLKHPDCNQLCYSNVQDNKRNSCLHDLRAANVEQIHCTCNGNR
uniref:Kinesin-like protein n=1 Tax=Marsilea vestita TaxID=59764 RepID=A0A142KWA9_MARVE|nr:kinesin 8-I protein [Marsilea vestita]